jgi:antagonist of KipI
VGRHSGATGTVTPRPTRAVPPGSQLIAGANPPILEILEPGLLSTVQDGGRPGYTQLGVPVSGACDPWGLAQANLLVGNDAGAAAIEITLSGPAIRVLEDCVLGIGGADLGAYVPEEFRDLPAGAAHLLRGGTSIRFRNGGHGVPSGNAAGMRSYLAVTGGIDVPLVLGSAATYLPGGFGGIEGRALRAGDRVHATTRGVGGAGRIWPIRTGPPPYDSVSPLRVLRGPHADLLGASRVDGLLTATWQVQPESDRSGVRLAADDDLAPSVAPEIASLPMVWGAVQVPPDGRPMVLLADHQTVGGYPVAAVVIRADWPRLGQLSPGFDVRFTVVSVEQAEEAWRKQHSDLDAARRAMAGTDAWEVLADAAG